MKKGPNFGYRLHLIGDEKTFRELKRKKGMVLYEDLEKIEDKLFENFTYVGEQNMATGNEWERGKCFSYVDSNGNFANVGVVFGRGEWNVLRRTHIDLLNPKLKGLERLAKKFKIPFDRKTVDDTKRVD